MLNRRTSVVLAGNSLIAAIILYYNEHNHNHIHFSLAAQRLPKLSVYEM